MRLTHLRLKGLTCFPVEVSLDLDALGPGLVAVVGANGQGKTTLLESVAAALYLDLPSRPGGLYPWAHGKDAFVEARFGPVGTRVAINAEQRKTEAYLIDGDDISSGKTREFQEEVVERFGSREAFLASVFSAQNRAGSFLDASKGARKSLFVELLGLGRLQELSEQAREKKRVAETALFSARAAFGMASATAAAVPALRNSKVEVGDIILRLQGDLDAARMSEESLRAEAAKLEQDQARLRSLHQQAGGAKRLAFDRQSALATVEQAPQGIRERAQRELDRLDEGLPQTMRDRAQERHLAARTRVESDAKAKVAVARARYDTEVEALTKRTRLIDMVPCTTWEAREVSDALSSTCPLLADANEAKANLDRSRFVEPDMEVWKASRFVDIDGALEKDLVEAQTVENRLAVKRDEVEAQLQKDLGEAREALPGAIKARDDASVEQARLEQEVGLLETSLAGPAVEGVASFAECKRQIGLCEGELADARQSLGGIEAKLEEALASAERAETLAMHVGNYEVDLVEWTTLEQALGKDGVQALEIDAAGPAVAGLANELLESCYGPRFSISFETLREKKSKAGEYTESFDILVYDEGEVRPIEGLSGGEKVIVGEAVGLALALFNSKRSGIRWETLWRDETAGALDPANAARYVDMLRRARELGGFHQVIFVSHQEQVWERADSRVRVEAGAVEVSA